MGRGRAKAKQTKVRPVETDFASLERELRGESYSEQDSADVPEVEIPDAYADLAEQYNSEYGDDGNAEQRA
ncbi:MAG: hypothetical protein CSA64_02030 [Arachnia propionica]|nr:MAG: hypothetical protein CSA64_02030 [Arachnia propionica]